MWLQISSEIMLARPHLNRHLLFLSSQARYCKSVANFLYACNTTVRSNHLECSQTGVSLHAKCLLRLRLGIWDWERDRIGDVWLETSSRRMRARKCVSAEGSREAGDLGWTSWHGCHLRLVTLISNPVWNQIGVWVWPWALNFKDEFELTFRFESEFEFEIEFTIAIASGCKFLFLLLLLPLLLSRISNIFFDLLSIDTQMSTYMILGTRLWYTPKWWFSAHGDMLKAFLYMLIGHRYYDRTIFLQCRLNVDGKYQKISEACFYCSASLVPCSLADHIDRVQRDYVQEKVCWSTRCGCMTVNYFIPLLPLLPDKVDFWPVEPLRDEHTQVWILGSV